MRSSSQSFDSKMSKAGVAVMPKPPQTIQLVRNSMEQAVSILGNIIPNLKAKVVETTTKSNLILLVLLVLGNGLCFGSLHITSLIRALE